MDIFVNFAKGLIKQMANIDLNLYLIFRDAFKVHLKWDFNRLITSNINKQLLDEHDIMNYQNRGLCYLPKPKAEVDNTDTRVW